MRGPFYIWATVNRSLPMFRLAAIFALIANTAAADPNFWKFEWPNTDFETTNVQSWVEILSGGPPKHGIPAIDGPSFVDVFDESRITDREPVITLELAGETPDRKSVV